MKVQDLMSMPAITCRADDSLGTAAQLMWENDFGVVPVVGDDGHIVGMVTDRDIAMAAYKQGRAVQGIPVSKAMSERVHSCHPGDSLDATERLMGEMQIRRVPVVDADSRPVGMLSINDIARHAATPGKHDGMERKLTHVLAAICEPSAKKTRPSPTRRSKLQQPTPK